MEWSFWVKGLRRTHLFRHWSWQVMQQWEKQIMWNHTQSNLTDTKIGCDGLKALCEALKANTTITALDLQCLEIMWKHNSPCCVYHFYEADNTISRPQATILADMLRTNSTLTELYLGSENTISSGFMNSAVHAIYLLHSTLPAIPDRIPSQH